MSSKLGRRQSIFTVSRKTKKEGSKYLKDDEFKLVKGFVENTCKNIEQTNMALMKISLALFDMDLNTYSNELRIYQKFSR